MATIEITASTNIKNITYASGDTLRINNNAASPVTWLTIDAQDAADVTKIEAFLVQAFSGLSNPIGGVAFKNNSITTPLIVKFNAQGGAINHLGPKCVFKTRGAWIEFGTSNGTLGQSFPMQIGGKNIKDLPFIQAERTAGSGDWVPMLNIGGAYNGETNVAYPNFSTFSQCGTTPEMGAFFEWDEWNGGAGYGALKLGTAAGGWVPLNGAKLRLPNIIFTSQGLPAASTTSRCQVTGANGSFDMEVTAFDHRWITGAQCWPAEYRVRNCGGVSWSVTSGFVSLDIDGWYGAIDRYALPTSVTFSGFSCPTWVKNIHGVTRASAVCLNVMNITDPREIGFLKGTILGRTGGFQACVGLNNIVRPDDSPLTCGPIITNGGSFYFFKNNNIRAYDWQFSDWANGVAVQTNSANPLFANSNETLNSIVEKVRLLPGGCPSYAALIGSPSVLSENFALHDVVFDGKNPQTLAKWFGGLSGVSGKRNWFANITIDNHRDTQYSTDVTSSAWPNRFSNIRSNAFQTAAYVAGAMHDMTYTTGTTLPDASGGSADAHWVTTHYTTAARTVGLLGMMFGFPELFTDQRTITSGVQGTDWDLNGSGTLRCPGVFSGEWTSLQPVKGIVAFTGGTLAISGTSTAGVTAEFQMKLPTEFDFPGAWTALSVANLQAALAALAGYDPNVGFDFKVRLSTSTTVVGREVTQATVSGIATSDTFTPTEVGFINVGVTNSLANARVAFFDVSGAPARKCYGVTDGAGAISVEFPYAFNGVAAQIRAVVRKPGYSDVAVDFQSYQAGKKVPAAGVAMLATTDAPVAGYETAINGPTKTYTPPASPTEADLYQHAQWWASQVANMLHAIPLTSTDGVTYTQPSDWTLVTGSITSGMTLAGGTWQIGAPGTYAGSISGSTLRMTAAGSYNLSEASIFGTLTLVNTSGGAIDIYLPAGTSVNNLGPNITVHLPVVSYGLAFSGLVAGSMVRVFQTGTQIELFATTNSGTSETWSETGTGSVTVDYTVLKDGYLPLRAAGVVINGAVVPVGVAQVLDRAYAVSSGLTFGTNALVNAGTKKFGLTVPTTGQNWYSAMIEAWRAQAALRNVAFPLAANGPNSFSLLDGWEFDITGYPNSITNLSRDGLRYVSAGGVQTAVWAAILTAGVPAGARVRYQQSDGGATGQAPATGDMDALVSVYGDAAHGNFDRRGYLLLKVQAEGYDEVSADAIAQYGALEDQLYVLGLAPAANGVATGNPSISGVTITDHGASPVTWNGKAYSITIVDVGGNSGTDIMRWLRASFAAGGAFQGTDAFNWHDLVRANGAKFRTVRGSIYGDAGAALKGVRVLSGANPHPDFDLFQADDGTTWVPPPSASVTLTGLVAGSRVQLYDTTNSVELANTVVAGTSYVWSETYSVDRTIRLRVMHCAGTSAQLFVDAAIGAITAGSPTISYIVAQRPDAVYATIAIDGALVSGITINDLLMLINISVGVVSWAQIYAYETWWLSTEVGIRDEGRIIDAPDPANYLCHSFRIKNTSVGALTITGGYGRDAATGTVAALFDISGGSIFPAPDHVVPYAAGAEATVATVQAGLSAQGYTPVKAGYIDAPISGVGGGNALTLPQFIALK